MSVRVATTYVPAGVPEICCRTRILHELPVQPPEGTVNDPLKVAPERVPFTKLALLPVYLVSDTAAD